MSYDNDPNALASALPAGIQYDLGGDVYWSTRDIATFQAARLAESGYQLVYVGDDNTTRQMVQQMGAEIAEAVDLP